MTGVKSERRRQKPLMERKRRARINRSLEQLKDVIVDNNGGILPRLDKARILELTVDYLQAKTLNGQISAGDERFKAGYLRCVNEVTSFLHDKVEDTRLTQIIQHLFTLTANIKSKVKAMKTPASSTSQGDATPSTSGSGVSMVTETSATKSIYASPSQPLGIQMVDGIRPNLAHQKPTSIMTKKGTYVSASLLSSASSSSSLTSSSSSSSSSSSLSSSIKTDAVHQSTVAVIKSMTLPDTLSKGKVKVQGHYMTLIKPPSSCLSTSVDTHSTQTTQQSFHKTQFFNWRRKQEHPSQGVSSRLPNRMVSTDVIRASRGACSREGVEEKHLASRTRRYGSVCSAYSGQSSTDSDMSADDEDVIMTETSHGHQGSNVPNKLDVDRDINYDISDSDDDLSLESEVFIMDSEDEASSGNDVPGNNGGISTSCSNSQNAQQRVFVRDGAEDRPETSRSPVWRPW